MNKIFGGFRKLLASPDYRNLVGNFVYLSILKVISFVMPLITMPYLATVIGVDKFGAIAFAASIVVLFQTITDWGFNYTATRDVAKHRENIGFVSEIFSEVLCAKTILMILSFIGLLVLMYCIPSLKSYKLLLVYTFASIPGYILFPEWLFQAFEKMKYITILNVLSKFLFTVLIFFVITKKEDYVYQPLLIACGYLLSGIIAQYIIVKKFKIHFRISPLVNVFRRLKGSTDMFLCLILPNLYTNFTTIILKSYGGDFATGIYSSGQQFQQIVDQLTEVLSRAFFPFLARHKDKHNVYVKISGTISIIACLVLFSCADLFVDTFYTEEFRASATVIRIFAITPFFLFLMNTYGTNGLVLDGREDILRNIIVSCSIGGFILTWLLTPVWGYIGATITVTAVWGIRGLVTYYYYSKELHNGKDIIVG